MLKKICSHHRVKSKQEENNGNVSIANRRIFSILKIPNLCIAKVINISIYNLVIECAKINKPYHDMIMERNLNYELLKKQEEYLEK
jgi:hypothetical protein